MRQKYAPMPIVDISIFEGIEGVDLGDEGPRLKNLPLEIATPQNDATSYELYAMRSACVQDSFKKLGNAGDVYAYSLPVSRDNREVKLVLLTDERDIPIRPFGIEKGSIFHAFTATEDLSSKASDLQMREYYKRIPTYKELPEILNKLLVSYLASSAGQRNRETLFPLVIDIPLNIGGAHWIHREICISKKEAALSIVITQIDTSSESPEPTIFFQDLAHNFAKAVSAAGLGAYHDGTPLVIKSYCPLYLEKDARGQWTRPASQEGRAVREDLPCGPITPQTVQQCGVRTAYASGVCLRVPPELLVLSPKDISELRKIVAHSVIQARPEFAGFAARVDAIPKDFYPVTEYITDWSRMYELMLSDGEKMAAEEIRQIAQAIHAPRSVPPIAASKAGAAAASFGVEEDKSERIAKGLEKHYREMGVFMAEMREVADRRMAEKLAAEEVKDVRPGLSPSAALNDENLLEVPVAKVLFKLLTAIKPSEREPALFGTKSRRQLNLDGAVVDALCAVNELFEPTTRTPEESQYIITTVLKKYLKDNPNVISIAPCAEDKSRIENKTALKAILQALKALGRLPQELNVEKETEEKYRKTIDFSRSPKHLGASR